MAGHHTNPDRFLDQAVVQVGRAIEIHHVKILRYRRATADLLMVAGTGWKEGVVRSATFSSDLKSPPGWSFQTGEPLCVEDFDEVPEFAMSQTLKEHDIVSLANVPVLTDGAAWGVLEVDSTVHRDFTQDSVQFMVAAAAIIGSLLRDDTSSRGEAAAQAQHREILLRELQHRVKNNFQLILASIGLQKRRFPEGETHRALDHITNRINAISLAHDQLAPRQDMQAVDVARYLRALCASIEQQVEDVALDIEADEVELSIDRAVPLGLILNEAATNSAKHAFPAHAGGGGGAHGGSGGRITIKLKAGIGFGEGRLTVSDNGHGIQKKNPTGSGLKLIESLARQIGGQVEIESSSSGTTTTVTFPIIS